MVFRKSQYVGKKNIFQQYVIVTNGLFGLQGPWVDFVPIYAASAPAQSVAFHSPSFLPWGGVKEAKTVGLGHRALESTDQLMKLQWGWDAVQNHPVGHH